MVEFNTPIDSARDAIESVLSTKLGSDATIYDHFPAGSSGVDFPSGKAGVVIQHLGSRDVLWGGGEHKTGGVKAIFLILRIQIDVYSDSEQVRDTVSDDIIEALWDARSTLKSDNRIFNVRLIDGRDWSPPEPYANLYRKMLRFDVTTEMTNG